MAHLNPAGKFKPAAAGLLASIVAAGMTACSEDSPTGPSMKAVPEPLVSVEILSAPANDAFDAAVPIPALPFTDSSSTADATPDAGDPATQCAGTGATVWYQFTPSADGWVTANTFGSEYDTGIAVYTGTPGQLTEIACNDDFNSTLSRINFHALSGETYFFMVGSFGGGDGGSLVFNVDVGQPPPEAGVTIAPTGGVSSAAGIPTIRGTVTCSRPVSVVIFGEIQQRAGRVLIGGSFTAVVECDGETSWEARTESQNGLFKGGSAEVTIFAVFFDPATGEEVFVEEEATVRLRGADK